MPDPHGAYYAKSTYKPKSSYSSRIKYSAPNRGPVNDSPWRVGGKFEFKPLKMPSLNISIQKMKPISFGSSTKSKFKIKPININLKSTKKKGGWLSPGIFQVPNGGVVRTPSPYTMRGGRVISNFNPPPSGYMATNIRTTPGVSRGSSGSSSGSPGGSGWSGSSGSGWSGSVGSSGRGSVGSYPAVSPGAGAGASYRAPSAPEPKALTYKQLKALAKNDPYYKQLLAAYERGEKLSKSQAGEAKGLFDTEYSGELSALERAMRDSRERTKEEAAAAGRLRSGVFAEADEDVLAGFQESKGRLGRSRNRGRTTVEQSLQKALEDYRLQRTTAMQDAINRLLAQRTDIRRKY